MGNVINNVLVFSKLYYCSPVWSSTTTKNISKLKKIQNFAVRIITNTCKFDHITPVLQELCWLPVSYGLMCMVGILTFKCVSDCFVTKSPVHDRNTRSKDYLKVLVKENEVPTEKNSSHMSIFTTKASYISN